MSKAMDRLLASPRRRVRYVYLRDAWPECPNTDPVDAILAAPDEAVIAALTREVETYGTVIQEERSRANAAELALLELREAVRMLVDAALARDLECAAEAQLALFDGPPATVDTPPL